jgi:hypothetical protein
LATVHLSKSELVNLFNGASNANHIVMKSVAINIRDKEVNMRRIRKLKDMALNGAKSIENANVRSLLIDQRCDRKILSILNDFPANCLSALVLRFPTNDMRAIQQFLFKQIQLRRLTNYTNFIHSVSIAHLHLTHLATSRSMHSASRRCTVSLI